MHARVAELARALRRRNSPAPVPPPANTENIVASIADQPSESSGHQSPPVEVAGEAFPSDVWVGPSVILSPGAIAAIEIASSGSKDASGDAEGAPTAGPSKSKKRKHKSKRPSKGKSSSKSSKRSSKRAERRAAKDAAEEEENTRQFKDQVTWWKQAREDLKTPSSRVAEMEGEKLNPDWAISSRSSVLRTLVGHYSFELYKTCCLDRDQVLLAQTAHTRVEEHLAHVLIQASAFGHNLALKCSMFRNNKADAEKRIHELEQSLENAKAAEKKALDDKVAADAQVADLEARLSATLEGNKKHVADALEQGRSDGFSAGRLAGKTEGMIEGRKAFLQSDDYKCSISGARLEGAKDFLKSSVFKIAVDLQSAQFLNEGFDKCIAQVAHLQGFAEGFDQTRLDASLDAHLQPYPSVAEPESIGEDEFASLTSELDLP
ncbi:hypothetical protein Salat_1460600 [Sesamum alatum]|uniref:Uncharacterized protein n=1 Tax=Sesamum alatum TaxID=300844 RepID=A0AAE2CLW5_9LAMI|nr:hypothetical protein Salat_1460600 [Sesamum alatum]